MLKEKLSTLDKTWTHRESRFLVYYNDEKIGQGKTNASNFLRENKNTKCSRKTNKSSPHQIKIKENNLIYLFEND